MSRKQSEYLTELLADDAPDDLSERNTGSEDVASPRIRGRGTTLLGRENALARIASGEVRQVTELKLDPAKCRIWAGNGRTYARLNEEICSDLIDSMISEGGQRVPAIVRRVDGDSDHEFEVIAGTRRHWTVSWLRSHSYPEMTFLAQVHQLDDEAAFRIADLENRARKDISDLERARNYAWAIEHHYGGVAVRMAERLKISRGWLSKMLKVAALPEAVVEAFATPADIQLKAAYPLAQSLDDKAAAKLIRAEASKLSAEQRDRAAKGLAPLPSTLVIARLTAAAKSTGTSKTHVEHSSMGRPLLTVTSANRQGVTIRLHSGAGGDDEECVEALRRALAKLRADGTGIQR
jgi:ParB family transcriptional regulator, chromosome partitioning protein